MNRTIKRAIGTAIALLLLTTYVSAATYYVDASTGNDSNDGRSEAAALRSVSRVNGLALQPGDAVLFRRAQSFGGRLDIDRAGSSGAPIRISAFGSGTRPILEEVRLSADYITLENVIVDVRKGAIDAVRIRSAENCIIRNAEIRNGTRDAIDVNRGDGLLVDGVEVHHFLNGSYGSKDDSHGVAITDTRGVTIRNANIHHVSGDSVQSDPNRVPGGISTDIVIEDSELWTGPLREDFNGGWRAGAIPGENALDTKVLINGFENEIRMNVTVRNVVAHGWVRVPEISNRSVFNLKEKINAVMDRITIYDAEIGFRIRGSLGNARTIITNTVIYNSESAIRAEDNASDLRVYFTTFGAGNGEHIALAGGTGGIPTWDFRNNAFLGSTPAEASGASNLAASNADFVSVAANDYAPSPTSRLLDAADPIGGVNEDRNGAVRSAPHDIGAYDAASSIKRPNPPVLDEN